MFFLGSVRAASAPPLCGRDALAFSVRPRASVSPIRPPAGHGLSTYCTVFEGVDAVEAHRYGASPLGGLSVDIQAPATPRLLRTLQPPWASAHSTANISSDALRGDPFMGSPDIMMDQDNWQPADPAPTSARSVPMQRSAAQQGPGSTARFSKDQIASFFAELPQAALPHVALIATLCNRQTWRYWGEHSVVLFLRDETSDSIMQFAEMLRCGIAPPPVVFVDPTHHAIAVGSLEWVHAMVAEYVGTDQLLRRLFLRWLALNANWYCSDFDAVPRDSLLASLSLDLAIGQVLAAERMKLSSCEQTLDEREDTARS